MKRAKHDIVLEWHESKNRTTTIDLEKQVIIKKGSEEKITAKNIPEVRRIFENNIEYLKTRLKTFKERIAITEVIREPIDDGYKLLGPLDDERRAIFDSRIIEMTESLKTIRKAYKDYKEQPKVKKKK